MIGMPTREQLEDQMRIAHEARMLWHAAAVERGDYEVHLESDQPPFIVTEFHREPVSPDRLEQLGIAVRCCTPGRNCLCPTCGQPADSVNLKGNEDG